MQLLSQALALDGLATVAASRKATPWRSSATGPGLSAVLAAKKLGAVGVPLYEEFEYKTLFWKDIRIKAGVAPARQHIPELLNHLANAYAAMDSRRAVKSLLTVTVA